MVITRIKIKKIFIICILVANLILDTRKI